MPQGLSISMQISPSIYIYLHIRLYKIKFLPNLLILACVFETSKFFSNTVFSLFEESFLLLFLIFSSILEPRVPTPIIMGPKRLTVSSEEFGDRIDPKSLVVEPKSGSRLDDDVDKVWGLALLWVLGSPVGTIKLVCRSIFDMEESKFLDRTPGFSGAWLNVDPLFHLTCIKFLKLVSFKFSSREFCFTLFLSSNEAQSLDAWLSIDFAVVKSESIDLTKTLFGSSSALVSRLLMLMFRRLKISGLRIGNTTRAGAVTMSATFWKQNILLQWSCQKLIFCNYNEHLF